MSYWNRAFFPEACADPILYDKTKYDTMMRMAGSALQIAVAFKEVIDMYGWRHVALLSDEDTSSPCWHTSQPLDEVIGHNENYTLTWLRLGSNPTDEQLDNILQQIRSHARGFHLYKYYLHMLAIFVNITTTALLKRDQRQKCCYVEFINLHKHELKFTGNRQRFPHMACAMKIIQEIVQNLKGSLSGLA